MCYRIPSSADSGFDGCWRYTLAAASAEQLVFGRDLDYSYGPLGWIAAPIRSPYHMIGLQAALLPIAVVAGLSIVRLVAVARDPIRGAAAGVLGLAAFAWPGLHGVVGIEADYQLVFVAVVALVTTAPASAWAPVAYALVGCCAGLAIAMKSSAVIDIGIACAVAVGTLVPAHRRNAGRLGAFAFVAFVISAAISLVDPLMHGVLPAYLVASIDTVGGYTGAMSDGSNANEARAAFATILIAFILLIRWGRGPGCGRIAAIAGVVLFLGWKHAIIREGLEHTPYLYATVALIAAVVVASNARTADAVTAGIIGAAAFVHLVTLYSVIHHGTQPTIGDAAIVAADRHWRGKTIDALPFDSVTAISAGAIYRPLPVFQLPVAYTSHLDELDATALARRGADVVLYRFATIGERYALADGPRVVRGLLCGYAERGAVSTVDRRAFIELDRTTDQCDERPVAIPETTGTFDLPVVRADNFIIARIVFKPTVRGRVDAVLWRTTLPTVAFRFEDGRVDIKQIVAATAADGIVVDPAPRNQSQAQALFGRTMVGNVRSLRIDPGPDYALTSVAYSLSHHERSSP